MVAIKCCRFTLLEVVCRVYHYFHRLVYTRFYRCFSDYNWLFIYFFAVTTVAEWGSYTWYCLFAGKQQIPIRPCTRTNVVRLKMSSPFHSGQKGHSYREVETCGPWCRVPTRLGQPQGVFLFRVYPLATALYRNLKMSQTPSVLSSQRECSPI